MSSITKAINLIKDRFKVVTQLKEMVFNESLKANEKDHLQKVIESHYWLFGEEYNLVTAEEQKFEEALRRYNHLLNGVSQKTYIKNPDKYKEMDIFACRKEVRKDSVRSIIVELKHPNIKLTRKELDQVKKYMGVIRSEPGFNGKNRYFNFYLVGKVFHTNGEIAGELKNAEHHGEKGLAYKENNIKIYVKTWDDVFTEFECKHNFILKKLELDQEKMLKNSENISVNELVENIKLSSASETATWDSPRSAVG